ncbi:MAG: hypothetical protein MNPFHGCM_01396 [Gemmatimonadaceae bacterium]|nr:hypothetical protein [Gemmatimonadaceae bacterium]
MTPPVRVSPRSSNTLVESLVDSLRSEQHLVEELTAIILTQRRAVTTDDLQGVDDSVFALQKVLLTLSEARRRRRSLNSRLGFAEDIPLRDLIAVMGDSAPDSLHAVSLQLQKCARALAGEVAINRQVLRESLAATDSYVRALTGALSPDAGYGDAVASAAASRQPKLINRRA